MARNASNRRDRIELLLEVLDAVRRSDDPLLRRRLYRDVVWRGLREDLSCHGRDAVARKLLERRVLLHEVESITLTVAGQQVLVHYRGAALASVDDVALPDGLISAFAIDDGKVIRAEDHTDRTELLPAGPPEFD